MDNVILRSISKGNSENDFVMEIEADGQLHRCVFSKVRGKPWLTFDDEFDRTFPHTDFGRPLAGIISRFVRDGQTPELPFRVLPHRQAVKHGG